MVTRIILFYQPDRAKRETWFVLETSMIDGSNLRRSMKEKERLIGLAKVHANLLKEATGDYALADIGHERLESLSSLTPISYHWRSPAKGLIPGWFQVIKGGKRFWRYTSPSQQKLI